MRTATCDKCGVAVSPHDPPAELVLGHATLTFDLCTFCAHGVRMEWLVRLDEWRTELDDAREEAELDVEVS